MLICAIEILNIIILLFIREYQKWKCSVKLCGPEVKAAGSICFYLEILHSARFDFLHACTVTSSMPLQIETLGRKLEFSIG